MINQLRHGLTDQNFNYFHTNIPTQTENVNLDGSLSYGDGNQANQLVSHLVHPDKQRLTFNVTISYRFKQEFRLQPASKFFLGASSKRRLTLTDRTTLASKPILTQLACHLAGYNLKNFPSQPEVKSQFTTTANIACCQRTHQPSSWLSI